MAFQNMNFRGYANKSKTLGKPMGSMQADNFATGASAVYIDQLHDQWKEDPSSVHASWKAYFAGVESGSEKPYQAPPNLGTDPIKIDNIDAIIA